MNLNHARLPIPPVPHSTAKQQDKILWEWIVLQLNAAISHHPQSWAFRQRLARLEFWAWVKILAAN
jgi:hypothetical protein